MDDKFARKAIVFMARLIFRLERQGKIYLSKNENTIIEYLRNNDFSVLDREE